MPILSHVGRKSVKGRAAILTIYLVLFGGAITMLYPFLLMLSGSIASNHSEYEFRLIPRYLYEERGLFETHVFNKYYRYSGVADVEQQWKVDIPSLAGGGKAPWTNIPIEPPSSADGQTPSAQAVFEYELCRKPDLSDPRIQQRISDYNEFREKHLPLALRDCYWIGSRSRSFQGDDEYREFLRAKYQTLEPLNEKYGTMAGSWPEVYAPYDRLHNRSIYVEDTPQQRDWFEFKSRQPIAFARPAVSEFGWSDFLNKRYKGDLEALNKAYRTSYPRFFDIGLSETKPTAESMATDWSEYVRTRLAARFMQFTGGAASDALWRSFQKTRLGKVELPTLPDTQAVNSPPTKQLNDLLLEFVATTLPLEDLRVVSAENLYRRFLLDKYGSLEALNTAHKLSASSIEQVYFPMPETDWKEMMDDPWSVKGYTLSRAYRTAINHILHHKQSLWNTAVFCAFAVAGALVVNPLCAYALSRFNLPAAYQILLFLLATMAFPAEVTIIPNFLMIKNFPLLRIVCGALGAGIGVGMVMIFLSWRKPILLTLAGIIGTGLGAWLVSDSVAYLVQLADTGSGNVSLLNTYWALVLPSIASGYSIFILKGFFDSLPAEIYESATIDGASELRIFATITLPLSKPVLAVIALWTFTAAYGSFTWALIICQDEKMWTLMVHLYQYQLYVDACERMAGFALASIPTLLVFILTQKMILKGIVLPSYK